MNHINDRQRIECIKIKNHQYFEDCELKFKNTNFIIGDNKIGKTLFFYILMCHIPLRGFRSKMLQHLDQKPEWGNGFLINNIKVFDFYRAQKTFAFYPADRSIKYDYDTWERSQNWKNYKNDKKRLDYIEYLNGCEEKHPKISKSLLIELLQGVNYSAIHASYYIPDEISIVVDKEENKNVLKAEETVLFFNFINSFLDVHISKDKKNFILNDLLDREGEISGERRLSTFQSLMLNLHLSLLQEKSVRDIFLVEDLEVYTHPTKQIKLVKELFSEIENQKIISTHSPYIVNDYIGDKETSIFVFRKTESGKIKIEDVNSDIDISGESSWKKTFGGISWLAFDLPTHDLHDFLYSTIEIMDKSFLTKSALNYIELCKSHPMKQGKNYLTSLHTKIRHLIHHPENRNNPITGNQDFSEDELRQSIKDMIKKIEKDTKLANKNPEA